MKQFLADAAAGVDIELLLQVGDAGVPLGHHLATAGLLQAGNQTQLGGFAGTVDAHQADAIPWFHLPGDVAQHLTGGIDLADAFEAEHGEGRVVRTARLLLES